MHFQGLKDATKAVQSLPFLYRLAEFHGIYNMNADRHQQ